MTDYVLQAAMSSFLTTINLQELRPESPSTEVGGPDQKICDIDFADLIQITRLPGCFRRAKVRGENLFLQNLPGTAVNPSFLDDHRRNTP